MKHRMKRRAFGSGIIGMIAGLLVAPFVRGKKEENPTLSGAELKRIAKQNPPSPEWYGDFSATMTNSNGDVYIFMFHECKNSISN